MGDKKTILQRLMKELEGQETHRTFPSPFHARLWLLLSNLVGEELADRLLSPRGSEGIVAINGGLNFLFQTFKNYMEFRSTYERIKGYIHKEPTQKVETFAAGYLEGKERIVWNNEFIEKARAGILPAATYLVSFFRILSHIAPTLTPPQGVNARWIDVFSDLRDEEKFTHFARSLVNTPPAGASRDPIVRDVMDAFADAMFTITADNSWLAQSNPELVQALRRLYYLPLMVEEAKNPAEEFQEIVAALGLDAEQLKQVAPKVAQEIANSPTASNEVNAFIGAIVYHEYLHILYGHIYPDIKEKFYLSIYGGAAEFIKEQLKEEKEIYGVKFSPSDSMDTLVRKVRDALNNAPPSVKRLVHDLCNAAEDYRINTLLHRWFLSCVPARDCTLAALYFSYVALMPFTNGLRSDEGYDYYGWHEGRKLGELLLNPEQLAQNIEQILQQIAQAEQDAREGGGRPPIGEPPQFEEPGKEGEGKIRDIIRRSWQRRNLGGGDSVSGELGEEEMEEGEQGEGEKEEEKEGEGAQRAGRGKEEQEKEGDQREQARKEVEKEMKQRERELQKLERHIDETYMDTAGGYGVASVYQDLQYIRDYLEKREELLVEAPPPPWYEDWLRHVGERVAQLPFSSEVGKVRDPHGIFGPTNIPQYYYDAASGKIVFDVYRPNYQTVRRGMIILLQDVSGSMSGLYRTVTQHIVNLLNALARQTPIGGFPGVYKIGRSKAEWFVSFGAADTQVGRIVAPLRVTSDAVSAGKKLLEGAATGGGTDMFASVAETLEALYYTVQMHKNVRDAITEEGWLQFVKDLRNTTQGRIPYVNITVTTDGDTPGLTDQAYNSLVNVLYWAIRIINVSRTFIHISFVIYEMGGEERFKKKIDNFKQSLASALGALKHRLSQEGVQTREIETRVEEIKREVRVDISPSDPTLKSSLLFSFYPVYAVSLEPQADTALKEEVGIQERPLEYIRVEEEKEPPAEPAAPTPPSEEAPPAAEATEEEREGRKPVDETTVEEQVGEEPTSEEGAGGEEEGEEGEQEKRSELKAVFYKSFLFGIRKG